MYFSVSVFTFLKSMNRPVPPTGTRSYFQHSSVCYVPTRMNQSGRLGHSQGHIPYQGRDCICSFVIHIFFPRILAPNLWFSEKRDQQPRGTSGDCSLSTLRLFHLSLYLCCITSSNKPSIPPSDPTGQVALISTTKIATKMKKIHNAESIRTV